MRKMLFICMGLGFLVTSIATASDVVSTNIVGYLKTTATGKYFTSGPTFVQVLTFQDSSNPQWRLGDIIAEGMDPGEDFIQFINPGNAKVRLAATYIPKSDPVFGGWWDKDALDNMDYDPANRLDDMFFPVSEGFLCYFETSGIELTYAGEVLTGSQEIILDGKYNLVANFLPTDILLGDVSAEGMDPGEDFVQFINPSNAKVSLAATYIPKSDPVFGGWWDKDALDNMDYDSENRLDGKLLPAGTVVLTYFASSPISIIFPDPLNF